MVWTDKKALLTAAEFYKTWSAPEELTVPQENWSPKIFAAFAEAYADYVRNHEE